MTSPAAATMTSEDERHALANYLAAVRELYGPRLYQVVLFGSRARGDARADSDLDLAVILDGPAFDFWEEQRRLSDLAYDAMVDVGLFIEAWPIGRSEWDAPNTHCNPRFLAAVKRDAVPVGEAA